MDIVGDRRFVEIPGGKTHELPPLLVSAGPGIRDLNRVVDMAADIVESEDLVAAPDLRSKDPEGEIDRRRMDLAINLVDRYMELLRQWQWGDSVLEWIRQCEITFENRIELRHLLCRDIWPHAGRSSFVTLLEDKAVETGDITIEKAVGLRLTFRQPPPISCFSNQFLLYLNGTLADTAYQTWSHLSPEPISSLPPERFQFDVVNLSLRT